MRIEIVPYGSVPYRHSLAIREEILRKPLGMEITKGDKACDWSTRYRSLVGYGTMEILSDARSKQEGLEVIMAQHGAPELVDFNQKNLDRMVILKLTISSMSGKQSSNWKS